MTGLLKYLTFIIVLIVFFTACKKEKSPDDGADNTSDTSTLVVQEYAYIECSVIDYDNTNGQLVIGLMNTEAQWNSGNDGTAYREIKSAIVNEPFLALFDALPAGTYAIKLYHDENGNDECDMNLLGIPTEKFGFSNNPTIGISGEPGFSECSFEVSLNDTAKVTIELRNVFAQ